MTTPLTQAGAIGPHVSHRDPSTTTSCRRTRDWKGGRRAAQPAAAEEAAH
ncbi:hypothetical protein [Actinomadura sp. 7K507]|nr:hypothetical protein [Actinomadura sp. 7K507]